MSEHLLASREGLFSVILVVTRNDLTFIVLKMYKEAAVISALMKVYSIVCNDRGHINPLKPELNTICYLLALLGAHHFLHVSRIRVKLLTFRLLMS